MDFNQIMQTVTTIAIAFGLKIAFAGKTKQRKWTSNGRSQNRSATRE